MACACKVKQQIDYIHKHYGAEGAKSKESHIREMSWLRAKDLLLKLLVVPLIPIMFIFTVSKAFTHKPITIAINKR